MFRRSSKTESVPTTDADAVHDPQSGKGRPTPSRKDAQAASRERAKAGMDKKTAQKVLRERRVEGNAKMRQALRTGDERYLPARDKGPVKRFVRTYVDSRLTIVEFLLPLLVVILVLQSLPNLKVKSFGAILMEVTVLVILVETALLVVRLKRAIRAEMPDAEMRGVTSYAVMRVIQIRPLRQPKPQVKVGGEPKPPKAPR